MSIWSLLTSNWDRSVVVNLKPMSNFLGAYITCFLLHLMANIWDIAISILARNLNSGLSYLITTVRIMTPQ